MTKPKPICLRVCGMIFCLTCTAIAQGGFSNPGFEMSWPYMGGQPRLVPTSDAIPGWGVLIDGNVVANQMHYEQLPRIYEPIAILFVAGGLGPGIEGNLSVGIYGGYLAWDQKLFEPPVGATPAETELWTSVQVPNDARSLEMKARGDFRVELGGQTLSAIPIQFEEWYTVYRVDVASFADSLQTFGVATRTAAFVDSFAFSPEAVPEPSATKLLIGALFLFLLVNSYRRRKWHCSKHP